MQTGDGLPAPNSHPHPPCGTQRLRRQAALAISVEWGGGQLVQWDADRGANKPVSVGFEIDEAQLNVGLVAWRAGARTVLAVSCPCGQLVQKQDLNRYQRRRTENDYIDRRCPPVYVIVKPAGRKWSQRYAPTQKDEISCRLG